jgi:hypothetical protein
MDARRPPTRETGGPEESRAFSGSLDRNSVLVSPSASCGRQRMIPRRPTREDLVGRPFPTSRIIAVEQVYQHPLCASDYFSGYHLYYPNRRHPSPPRRSWRFWRNYGPTLTYKQGEYPTLRIRTPGRACRQAVPEWPVVAHWGRPSRPSSSGDRSGRGRGSIRSAHVSLARGRKIERRRQNPSGSSRRRRGLRAASAYCCEALRSSGSG